MENHSDTNQREIWANGTPMSNAWLAYAPPDLKEKWNAALNKSPMKGFEKGIEEARSQYQSVSEIFMGGIMGSGRILNERTSVKETLQANLVGHIKRGHLLAFGFEPPRSMSSLPAAIPPEVWVVWNVKLDWMRSSVSGQGLEFIEVRLILPRMRDQLIERKLSSTAIHKQQVGRPSIKLHVQQAFASLEKLGRIDVEQSAKAHFPLVREHMRKTHPDRYPENYKLGDEGIRSHFSPLFNKLKENRKQ